MHHFTVSVIVAVFNMEKYLSTCIDSLLNQTYKNLTIVLVNDCSTDNSLLIMKDYERRYSEKIKVIDSKVNLKQGGARNLGIRMSQSDYIGFVDADDFVHPGMYELLMDEVEKNNVEIVYCGYETVEANSSFEEIPVNVSSNHYQKMVLKRLSADKRMEIMSSHQYGGVWGGIYKRSLIEDNGLFFPEYLAYEDNYWVYALQLIMETLAVIPQKCYYYRQHGESTVHKKNALHHYDRIEISKRLLNFVKEKELLQPYYRIIEFLFIEVFTLNSYSMFVNCFDQPQVEKINQAKNILKEEFPRWRSNKFYKKKFSAKKKLKINLMMILPTVCYINLMSLKRHLF